MNLKLARVHAGASIVAMELDRVDRSRLRRHLRDRARRKLLVLLAARRQGWWAALWRESVADWAAGRIAARILARHDLDDHGDDPYALRGNMLR